MKVSFKGRGLRSMEHVRDSPRRLQEALKYNHGLKLPEGFDNNRITDMLDLAGNNKKQKMQDVDILLANLLNAGGKSISVSLNTHAWRKSSYKIASLFTINAIKQFNDLNLIDMNIGYQNKTRTISRLTRITPTDRLKELCPALLEPVIYEPVNLVELRDWKGKLIEYTDRARTWKVKEVLQRVNAVNGKADIRCGNERYKAFLTAIYKQKFTLYGRLHTRGFHHVQGLSEEERSELTIDRQKVVELDFSAFHPNLLYASMGIQYKNEQYQDDPYQVLNPYPAARPYLKQLLLYLLNSKDFIQAEKAGNYWLRENRKEAAILRGIGIKKARPLLEAYFEVHKEISHFFLTGKETGLRTMNLDARIALDIVNDFAKLGICIIPIHDSFVVQEQYKDRLLTTMLQRYKQHTKGFTIPIK